MNMSILICCCKTGSSSSNMDICRYVFVKALQVANKLVTACNCVRKGCTAANSPNKRLLRCWHWHEADLAGGGGRGSSPAVEGGRAGGRGNCFSVPPVPLLLLADVTLSATPHTGPVNILCDTSCKLLLRQLCRNWKVQRCRVWLHGLPSAW